MGAVITPAGEGSLEQLVQQLKNVRQQQKALAAQEEELLGRIAKHVEEQRKALQKAEELLRQLRQEKDRTKQDRQDIPEKKNVEKGGPDHNP